MHRGVKQLGAGTPLRMAGGAGSADEAWRSGAPADDTLVEVVRAAVAVTGAWGWGVESGWGVAFDSFWCTVRPPGNLAGLPAQGWKIHVSAASTVAAEVLSAVAGVVADNPCVFKFAADRERLHQINSRNSERGSAGKFITLYPGDEREFGRLAEELHRATEGMPGPVVLSDRPFAPGSRVHYRYGAFAARAELGNDGAYRSVLRGPGGERAEDVRGASYRCPPWAVDPLEGRGSAKRIESTAPAKPTKPTEPTRPADGARRAGVLVGDRYALTAAVRHGAKGGVFLGTDTRTGEPVVVKQARACIEVDRAGTDARSALRHEARLLAELAGQQLTPRPLGLIEQDDSLLLVQERIPGQPLSGWVAARLTRDGAPDVPWAEAGPMALALVTLVERVHAAGLVLRDLSPSNVMVQPDGQLRLVDLELARPADSVAGSAGTPGYRAPEQTPGPLALVDAEVPYGSCRVRPQADLYALGGLLFLLATGHDPLLPEDLPAARPVAERLGRWLALAARDGLTARRLAAATLGLRAEDPSARWGLAQVRASLEAAAQPDTEPATRPGTEPATHPGTLTVAQPDTPTGDPAERRAGHQADRQAAQPLDHTPDHPLDRLLHDGLRHLLATATPQRPDRLWPTVPAGQLTDPCNVQHGAAGVLAVLARATATEGLPAGLREETARTARLAADWIERRCAAEPVALPGLHFGRSGPAWALLDAAEALADPELATRARRLAAQVPLTWPNPDVCHGAAGAGLLHLRLGERAAVLQCARGLLAAATEEPYGTVWPVPKGFDSSLAGITHLGYGHGVAGVGAFLLAAHQATGDAELLAGAERAGRTLAATARRQGEAARWPQSAGDPATVRLTHWCSGSSGVGSFLIRLWRATGDPAARELAVAAGLAVLADRWHSGSSACHGLAGDGEFLLDLAQLTGEERFALGAEELARLLAARAALRDGLLVLPDETGTGCAAAYGTGTAGALAFLLRLLHGGPRLWLDPVPSPAITPADAEADTDTDAEADTDAKAVTA